jgi:hypothetical protein
VGADIDTGRPVGRLVPSTGVGTLRSRFTVYLDFVAVDAEAARVFAAGLAKGLGALCIQVDAGSALWSPAGLAGCAEPVFCAAVGPDGQVCADVYGHAGWHAEAGADRLRNASGDLPDRMHTLGDLPAETPPSTVTGYRAGGTGRPTDLPYLDYDR